MHSSEVVSHGPYRGPASRLTIFAHLFGVLAFILMLVWLLHYRGGIEYDSYDGSRVFNVRKKKQKLYNEYKMLYFYL